VEIVDIPAGNTDKWRVGSHRWKQVGGLLNSDHSRLLLYGTVEGDSWSADVPHAELWNLTEKTRLRDFTSKGESHFPNWVIFADSSTVNLARDRTHDEDSNTNTSWNWIDGKDAVGRGQLVLLATGNESKWALELNDSKLILRGREGHEGVVIDAVIPSVPIRQLQESSSFQVAADDSTLALTLNDERAGLFDVKTGKHLCTFPHDHRFRAFDSSGKWCATIGSDRKVILWDTRTAEPLHTTVLTWPIGGRSVRDITMKIHPSGQQLALWTHGAIILWDVERNVAIRTADPARHHQGVRSLAQSHLTNSVASGGNGGEVLIWNLKAGEVSRSILADTDSIAQLAFHPDGAKLAYCTDAGKVAMLSADGKQMWTANVVSDPSVDSGDDSDGNEHGGKEQLGSITFHPAGRLLAVGRTDGTVLFLESSTGSIVSSVPMDTTAVVSLAFSPDGTVLAVGSIGGRLHIWEAAKGVRRSHKIGSPVRDITFVGNAGFLATASQGVQFWETQDMSETLRLTSSESPVERLALIVSSGTLCAMTQEGEIRVYNLTSLEDRLAAIGLGLSQRLPKETIGLSPEAHDAWVHLLAK
jgi:WD40 repeat protein